MQADDAGRRPPYSVDRVLLTRYVAGEVSPPEAVAVEQWLAADPSRGNEVAELRRIWARAGELPSGERVDALWRDLRQQMHEPVPRRLPALELALPRAGRPARRWIVGGLVAAGLAAAVGIAVRARLVAPAPPAVISPARVYSTVRGQRAVVELADGTRVQLGVDSRVRVWYHDDGRREVRLEGEAVFDVVHDARRPFVVYAGNAVTEDLGTRFGVRAYPGDRVVRVIVASGQVAVRPASRAASPATRDIVLGPRDVGELDTVSEVRVRGNVDPERYLSWTRGRLVFDETPILEVAAQLSRWYDVTVAVADSTVPAVAERRLTLELDAPSLQEALDAVVTPLGWRYERRGSAVVLRQ